MFTLTRISTTPATPLRIVVSQPEGGDAGLHVGGSFYFQPAGDAHGDDRASLSEFAARAILGDPGLAGHFLCDPPLPPAPEAPAPPAADPSAEIPAPAEPPPARRAGRARATPETPAGD